MSEWQPQVPFVALRLLTLANKRSAGSRSSGSYSIIPSFNYALIPSKEAEKPTYNHRYHPRALS